MKHSDRKIGKLTDELVTYLLKKQCNDINISIKVEGARCELVFTFIPPSPEILELLKETLTQERDESIEEYGWELLGENDCSGELNLIGMCIDECQFTSVENKAVIKMIRTK